MAAHQDGRPLCHVCLEGDDEAAEGGGRLVHGGCGCRGSAGFGHLPCLVEAATHNPDSWTMCPTCRQYYTGPVSLGLARARDKLGSTILTKNNLAKALQDMGQFAEARRLYEAAVTGSMAELSTSSTLRTKGNLAKFDEGHGPVCRSAAAVRGGGGRKHGGARAAGPQQHSGVQEQPGGGAAEARRMFKMVVAGHTAQLGPAHFSTLLTKGNLANVLT